MTMTTSLGQPSMRALRLVPPHGPSSDLIVSIGLTTLGLTHGMDGHGVIILLITILGDGTILITITATIMDSVLTTIHTTIVAIDTGAVRDTAFTTHTLPIATIHDAPTDVLTMEHEAILVPLIAHPPLVVHTVLQAARVPEVPTAPPVLTETPIAPLDPLVLLIVLQAARVLEVPTAPLVLTETLIVPRDLLVLPIVLQAHLVLVVAHTVPLEVAVHTDLRETVLHAEAADDKT